METKRTQDEKYMQMAVDLAWKGAGRASPNPLVGAVIVKDGRVIGRGYHERYGGPHAERNALANCTEDPAGATIYVTLEPCNHYGKTPPCTEAILESGLARVVAGAVDPNPQTLGKSLALLRERGLEVESGVLPAECGELIKIFSKYVSAALPYVIEKWAMTLDGKIAAYTGASRWITGEEARRRAHQTRNLCTAIMVGVETVLRDDPLLTCRLEGGRDPVRIVCDSRLRTPLTAKIVRTAAGPASPAEAAKAGPACADSSAASAAALDRPRTIIATCESDPDKLKPYLESGCRVIVTAARDGRVDLRDLTAKLAAMKIDSVLVEGGGELNWSALEQKIVDAVEVYIAPKILGGRQAKTPVAGRGAPEPDCGFQLQNARLTKIGADYLIEGEVKY